MGIIITFAVIVAATSILFLVVMWKIYLKAGQPGWSSIIPFYSTYILFAKIIKKPLWLFGFCAYILYFFRVPFLSTLASLFFMVATLMISLELGKVFNKSKLFSVVGLWMFGFVGYPILAFGDAQYSFPETSVASQPIIANNAVPQNTTPQVTPETKSSQVAPQQVAATPEVLPTIENNITPQSVAAQVTPEANTPQVAPQQAVPTPEVVSTIENNNQQNNL